MLAVLFYFCCVGLFLSLSLVAPIFVALLGGEAAIAGRLTIYLILGGFLFATPVLAIADRQKRIPQVGGLLLLVMVWVVLPLMAAIPIMDLSDLGFTDSVFESVSGLTTTGASTIKVVDDLPQALIFWRIQLQWFGGFLALMTVFAIIAPMGIGGLSLNAISMQGHKGKMAGWGRIVHLVINYGLFYIAVTTFAFLLFFMTGQRAFHAATLAMTAVSTGGFLPFDSSLDSILGPTGQLIFAGFLIFGATSVFWHRMLIRGQVDRLKEHRESYSVLILIGVLGVSLAMILISVSGEGSGGVGPVLIEGLFNASSLVATSGIESRPGIFSLLPLPLILFVLLLGGSAFSTSGGLKHYRVGAMIVQSWNELDRLIYPSAVRPSRFGTQHYDLQLMKAIWSFFVVAILTLSIGTIIVATGNIPFEAALTATISAFATAGPVYNSGWPPPGADPWPLFANFTDTSKWALMAVMLLGRLEVLAVIGIFSTHYWRNR